MVPAARGATAPALIGQARHSSSPTVKNCTRPRRPKAARISRSLAGSLRPRSSRNARASEGSSEAISSSTLAEIAHSPRRRREAYDSRPNFSTKSDIFGTSDSSRLAITSSGLAVRKANPRIFLTSSSVRSSSRMGVSRSRASRQRFTTGSSSSSSLFFAFLMLSSSRSRRRCATSRSARISSVSMLETSRRGSSGPWPCGIESSRKARTTWAMASTLRISFRSSVFASPFSSPWMSRKSTWA